MIALTAEIVAEAAAPPAAPSADPSDRALSNAATQTTARWRHKGEKSLLWDADGDDDAARGWSPPGNPERSHDTATATTSTTTASAVLELEDSSWAQQQQRHDERELRRRMQPRTRADFALLYEELAAWWGQEQCKIASAEGVTGVVPRGRCATAC